MSDEERSGLLEAVATTAQALRRDGVIVRIWRIPGRCGNVGVWSAPDATVLHEHITSLPLAEHAEIKVTALATRYLEQA